MLYNYFILIDFIDCKELCNYSGTQILLLKIILSFALSKQLAKGIDCHSTPLVFNGTTDSIALSLVQYL